MLNWVYWIISGVILAILLTNKENNYNECKKTNYVDEKMTNKIAEIVKNTKINSNVFNSIEDDNLVALLSNEKIFLKLKLNENDLDQEKINTILSYYY